MIIRTGTCADRDALKNLWKLSFDDEDEFVSWFFSKRYNPEFISLAECCGKIVSAMHSMPVSIRVRDCVFKGILISGVATLPEFRGRGYMHDVMKYHIGRMKKKGFEISVLKAVRPQIYYSLDHRIINDLKIVNLKDESLENPCEIINIDDYSSELYKCYQSYAKKFSCLHERSHEDFILKLSEYIACGANCIVCRDEFTVNGYCIYYKDENELCAEECVALSDAAYSDILNALSSIHVKTKKVKLAPNVEILMNNDCEMIYGNSGYPINMPALLHSLGLSGYSIEVTDNVITDNNCRYSLSGEVTEKEPNLKISAGFLLQWIVGYKSIQELIDLGHAVLIRDDGIVAYMDSVGKQTCFSIDEY